MARVRSAHGQPRRRRHAAAADDEPSTVSGVGVGDTTYRGRACVVRDLMLAFDQLEPGDVLVTPFTGPSVNSLLPVIGASWWKKAERCVTPRSWRGSVLPR